MKVFVSTSLVGGGIYHCIRNRETIPMVVSVVGVVAEVGWVNIAPP